MLRLPDILDSPSAYRLWQFPFAKSKLLPVVRNNDISEAKRVLDVGCGPGTNSAYFGHTDYLGLDLNPSYIKYARQTYRGEFRVADLRTYLPEGGRQFDFILANSLFHHIDDENTDRILRRLSELLTSDGHVHILDLVLPKERSISRWLARSDRGDYPRPLEVWNEIFSRHFEPVVFEAYPVGSLGLTLWQMVYFKGRSRT